MGASQGSQPGWEKPTIVELDAAEDAAGSNPGCTIGTSAVATCIPGTAAFSECGSGTGGVS